MFTKILVAVNANSIDTVLASAIDTARKHDACILALHAVNPAPYLMSPIDYDFALMIEAMEAHGREIVARMAQVLDNHSGPAETRMITLPLSGLSVGRGDRFCRQHVGSRPDYSRRTKCKLAGLAERRRCSGGAAPCKHADSDGVQQSHQYHDAS